MNIQFTSSKRCMRINIGRILWMLFLAFLTFTTPATLSAQESEQGITTLMPTAVLKTCGDLTISADNNGNPICSVLLRFKTDSFPSGAKLTAARLILIAQTENAATENIKVNMLPFGAELSGAALDQGAVLFGAKTVNRGSLRADEPKDWTARPEFVQTANVAEGFSLRLDATKRGGRQWHSDQSAISQYRPRLILEYTVDGQPAVTQADGLPAVQSPRPFLPAGERAAEDNEKFYVPLPFVKAYSYAPAFYNNLVYLVIDNDSQKQLQALDPIGNPVWPMIPLESPGQHLLVSKSGHLYIIGANRILVYQLDSQGQPNEDGWRDVPGLNPGIAPSLGPDGSLYFVNGIEVYGLNPDLQELWKVTLSDQASSRVIVGPSGQFVYLTAKKEGLVAINAQTGKQMNISPSAAQTALSNEINIRFHAPVVVRHPDETEIIYAAANSANNGVLAKFDNRKTAPGQSDSGTIAAAANWKPPPGLWSQPILDQLPPGNPSDPARANPAKKIYAVRVENGQGTLMAIDWLTGSTSPVPAAFTVAASPYLLNGGNLAMDQDGNIFVWNGAGSEPGLYAFGPALSGLLASPDNGIPAKTQLYFGSDGTLYANGVDGRVLRAIVPQYTLDTDSGVDISSPTHLRVVGSVNKDTTLAAGGTVFLGNGFAVKRGATLRINKPLILQ